MKVEELGWKFACKIWTDKESASRDCVQIARHDVPCHGKCFAEYWKKKKKTRYLYSYSVNGENLIWAIFLQIFFFRKKSGNVEYYRLVFWANSWTNVWTLLVSYIQGLGIYAVSCIIVYKSLLTFVCFLYCFCVYKRVQDKERNFNWEIFWSHINIYVWCNRYKFIIQSMKDLHRYANNIFFFFWWIKSLSLCFERTELSKQSGVSKWIENSHWWYQVPYYLCAYGICMVN